MLQPLGAFLGRPSDDFVEHKLAVVHRLDYGGGFTYPTPQQVHGHF